MLGTCGFAQASSQADGPPFGIKPHHTGISVPNLEDRDLFLRARQFRQRVRVDSVQAV